MLVYNFHNQKIDGNKNLTQLLGNKAANLCEMKNMSINVPCGFVFSTEACQMFFEKRLHREKIIELAKKSLQEIEKIHNMSFTSGKNKLLLSVRSGASISMPGMMDTVLNLGMNKQIIQEMLQNNYDSHFVYDTYRRFIQNFASVVLKINTLEDIIDEFKNEFDVVRDCDFTTQQNQKIIAQMQEIITEQDKTIPSDVYEQLADAIVAVFESCFSERCQTYRQINNIKEKILTAASVQMMVFGNLNENSGTGVCFTRNPSTGKKEIYGDFLQNAQGEDIVAGTRTPNAITEKSKKDRQLQTESLEKLMPEVFVELQALMKKLEHHYRDMQDIEFTVQNGQLFILQTRAGKRTASAGIKIALDLLDENLIDEIALIKRINPKSLEQILHPVLDPKSHNQVIAQGLPASPGCVSGFIAFSSEEVEKNKSLSKNSILVRIETSPEDIKGMHLAQGILTARGGLTSHAAVVARGMGKSCVCGAKALKIDYKKQVLQIGNKAFTSADEISIDGSTGKILAGKVNTITACASQYFDKLLQIAKKHSKLKVIANAESLPDIKNALQMGASGIGLCRTEHMFFEPQKIMNMRQMILSTSDHERNRALRKLFEMQKQDFAQIFELMQSKPVTIRLLDPPLHEFLPHDEPTQLALAEHCEVSLSELQKKINNLRENNPMLGLRGCRLGIVHPEIYKMQIKAIFEAAQQFNQKNDLNCQPNVMIPFIINKKELLLMKNLYQSVAQNYPQIDTKFGIMIETPAAALIAEKLAQHVDFFSFGSNDLTQTTLALSRDDSDTFMPNYLSHQIFEYDPFCTLHFESVGKLIQIAIDGTKKSNPQIKIGICGEHGGDLRSMHFLQDFDSISCSPFRIPMAILQSAQLAIESKKTHKKKALH